MSSQRSSFPRRPVDFILDPVARFLHIQAASGVVLLICTVAALWLANSQWSHHYFEWWHIHAQVGIGSLVLDQPLEIWINDGLMTLFFFVVGLEIKREMVSGELREIRRAALPIVAALGGMVVPATIYTLLQHGQPGERGWGVPMATDIAFVVGVLALLGNRVPHGLKVLLLSLAIVDDIGAILVIAACYNTNLVVSWLVIGLAGFALTYALNRMGVRSVVVYVIVGAMIWLAFLKSGVHPTVAGVMLGLLTPASAMLPDQFVRDLLSDAQYRLVQEAPQIGATDRRELALELVRGAKESVSPLERLEHAMHGWVSYVIMPVFAFSNAGVPIAVEALRDPIALSVAAGLVLGKPLGIVLFSWLAIRLGVARPLEGVTWPILLGGGCLAGIGFTMSLFISGLAFAEGQLAAAKLGTLLGSVVSACLGTGILLATLKKPIESNATRA
ncbi:MAG: Na+/H+ antiporter NhaA [Planctomycetota bacterium]|nr:Na+/H+ antiporter NhaA [Planctomycetota bacterium]